MSKGKGEKNLYFEIFRSKKSIWSMIKNIIYTCTSLHNLDIFEELLFNLIINILKKSYIKDSHSTIILKFIPNTHRIFHIQYSTYIPILFISKLILEILSFVSCAICKRRSNNEGKRRRKTKKRGRNGRKRKGYTCDSSETRRIKRIHRGNVNMHHRLDRIPVRIIPSLFRRWPIHSRRISFSVLPLSAFFISLCVTCTRDDPISSTYAFSFDLRAHPYWALADKPSLPLHRYETTILEISSQEFFPFPPCTPVLHFSPSLFLILRVVTIRMSRCYP